jgi:hypothetical protein
MSTGRPSPEIYAGLCLLIVIGFAPVAQADPPKALPVTPAASDATAASQGDSGSSFDNLEIVDSSLKGKLGVLRVGSQVADNNLLSVFAGFKNKTSHKLALEVMTIYKDKAGNALNAASWIPLTLKAKEEREYRSSSITEQADDFMIRVRRLQSHK